MARCKGADEFVNCVARRGDRDMFLKPSLIIAAIVVPLILGLALAIMIIWIDELYDDRDTLYEVLLVTAVTAFVVELCIISFMIYCVSRRNRNHLKRDMVWMNSLCDFVDFHGGNSDEMRHILKKSSRATNKFTAWLSMLVWMAYVVLLIVAGYLLIVTDISDIEGVENLEIGILMLTVLLLVILLIDLMVTVGTTLGFPSRHDSLQAKFTKEFSAQCAKFRFEVKPMKHDVKRRHQWIHLVLVVITLGLYGIVYLVVTCRDMNRHLRTQWAYETDLMERIVEFEGGTGIEATDEGKRGTLSKIVNALM